MNKRKILFLIGTLIALVVLIVYQDLTKQEEVVLEIGIYSGNEWNVPQIDVYRIYDEAIRLFEENHPGVKVTYRSGTLMDDYSEWLAQQILQGNEPDVFIVLEEDFNTLSSIGMLEPLGTYMEKSKQFHQQDFYEKALDAGKYGNSQYTIPFQIVPTFMIVNQSLLEKNNLDVPETDWTLDTFLTMCEELTLDQNQDGKMDQFGVIDYTWDNLYYAMNGRFQEGSRAVEVYEEEKLEKAIEYSNSLYRLNMGQIISPYAFDQGLVAFKPFSLAEFRAYKPYPYKVKKYSNFIWEPIAFPGLNQETSIGKLYTVQWGMSSRSKHEQLAWDFIEFMSNDKTVQQMVWDYTYALPTNKEVTKQACLADPDLNEVLTPEFLEFVIQHSVIEPTFKTYEDLIDAMDLRIKVSHLEGRSVQEIIRRVRQEADSVLQEKVSIEGLPSEERESYRFGATYMTLNNPFFVLVNSGIQDIVEANGDLLIALDPALDSTKQVEQVYDLIRQKVDAIFVNPVDWKSIKPALVAAQEAGIPVINVDAPVYDTDLVQAIIASDNYSAGVLCAQDMMSRLEGGKIVIIEQPTAKSAIDRTQGFIDTIADDKQYEIIAIASSEGQLEQAMPVMKKIIQENKEIDVVMALNDPTAMGVYAALQEAGREEGILIYGVDGAPESKQMIKEGKMTATAAQSPITIGNRAARIAYDILAGKTVETEIDVELIFIDQSNVDIYGTTDWQ